MTKRKKRNNPETWKRRIVYLKQKLRALACCPWTTRIFRLAHAAKEELTYLYKKLELTKEPGGSK